MVAVTEREIEAVQTLGAKISAYYALPALYDFHFSDARYRWLFGGNRSGKSEGNIGYDLCTFAMGCHPNRKTPENAIIWAACDTWDMVGKVLWEEKICQYLPSHQVINIVWHNKNANIPKEIRLRNGNRIELKAFQQGREIFQGRAIDAYYQDEQCKYNSYEIWTEIQARLADRNGFAAFSATPLIPQAWLEDIAQSPHTGHEVFYANLNDNRKSKDGYIDDAEIDNLIAEWPEEVQETRVAGRFAAFFGAVYKSFNRQVHIIEPFKIPKAWERFRVIDWGFNNPFVCLWTARDPKDNIWYIYDEYYRARESLAFHAKNIHTKSAGDKFRQSIADHDPQDAKEFRDMDIPTIKAKKDIRAGIEAVQRALKIQGNGKPRLFVFKDCKHTVREMIGYHYPDGTDMKDPKDEPVKKDDHCPDCVRYLIYTREGPKGGVYVA